MKPAKPVNYLDNLLTFLVFLGLVLGFFIVIGFLYYLADIVSYFYNLFNHL